MSSAQLSQALYGLREPDHRGVRFDAYEVSRSSVCQTL